MGITRRQAIVSPAAALGAASMAVQGGEPAKVSPRPPRTVSVRDFERLAPEKMTREAWEFISSGAGDQWTLRWNEEAFQQLRLRPRVLIDVNRLDTRIRLLGREHVHPILLSPTSNHQLVHPEGELETARGAGAGCATMIVSTFSDKPLEEIARVASQPLWHATYILKDAGKTKELIRRVEAVGCEAICIPVDSPVVGARDREHRTYRFAKEPVSFLEHPADYWRFPATWKDIEWVRSQTKLPIVLKGILDAADAEAAIQSGTSAVFVSNHGGRNLDTLPATLDALPEVVERVAGRVPVLVDGGIRRGTDVLKALALGATAVGIGRPYLYALAVAGADGVRGVINVLRNELEMAMALTGRPTIAAIDRSALWSGAAPLPKR